MRTSKIASVVAILTGIIWLVASGLSWGDSALSDLSETLWLGGLGGFALASGLTGYASVTRSPLWLRAIVFLGAIALGVSIMSTVPMDNESSYVVVAAVGALVLIVGLLSLLTVRGHADGHGDDNDDTPPPPVHGRRAAR